MALNAADWASWQKTIAQAATDSGFWVGLCNEEGEPVLGLPMVEFDGSTSNMGLDELNMTIPVETGAGPSPLVDWLVGEGLGAQDEASTALVPQKIGGHSIVVQGPGGPLDREAYLVTYPELAGDGVGPLSLQAKAVHMNTLLDWHPCPSVPGTWGDVGFSEWKEDASTAVSGKKYTTPRQLAPMQVATIQYGHTSKGPGVATVRRVIQDSLDAVNRLHGYTKPHLVVDWSPITRDTDTDVLIVRDDRYLWETISEPCRLFGMIVQVVPWWPGDGAFPTRTGTWNENYAVGRVIVKMLGE